MIRVTKLSAQRAVSAFRFYGRVLHSMATVSQLRRMQAATLAELLRKNDPSIAIIDVREDDHIGGHIKGSLNFPSHSLDATMPTLVRKLGDKQTVVFHCALSQERGPRAALKYLRERESQEKAADLSELSADTSATRTSNEPAVEPLGVKDQAVYVLDRGFVGWQRAYGHDKDLTEGYRPEIWEDY